MKRYSKQREIILNSLKNRTDHPTAETLYQDIKTEVPEIGIATVYRNLSNLYEEGVILKVKSKAGGPDRYDGTIKPHIHFECENCKEVYDIFLSEKEMEKIKETMNNMASLIQSKAKKTSIHIIGKCKNCKE